VIGRLVEQENVRLLQQQLRQRDSHLPAAGEFLGSARPVVLAEAEAVQHTSNLRFDRIAVARAKLTVDSMEAVGDRRILSPGRIQIRHLVRERLQLDFHIAQIGKHRHALGEYGAAGQGESILREIAGGQAAHGCQRPVIEAVDTGQNLEKRGFSGSIRAHDAGALPGRDEPVEFFKQQFMAESFAGPGQLNHVG
jgi:hypothetical protein